MSGAGVSCRGADPDIIHVDVTPFPPPARDSILFGSRYGCDADPVICRPVSRATPDGNLSDCHFNGPSTTSGSSGCITPATSGGSRVTPRVITERGAASIDSVSVDDPSRSKASTVSGTRTILPPCHPQEGGAGCVSDVPDGTTGLIDAMVSSYGQLLPASDEVCILPTIAGGFEAIAQVSPAFAPSCFLGWRLCRAHHHGKDDNKTVWDAGHGSPCAFSEPVLGWSV